MTFDTPDASLPASSFWGNMAVASRACAVGLTVLVSACASAPEDKPSAETPKAEAPKAEVAQTATAPAEQAENYRANDPLEPLNRTVYGVNWVVDHTLLRPLAMAYRAGTPDPVQKSVRSALRNLHSPVVLANDLMQGEWDRAWTTTVRFVVNTTVGVLGFYDAAADFGYSYHDEDFGQTMAVAGVGEGPYLVLPLLGPSNPRDAVGTAVDWLMDPFRLYTAAKNDLETAQMVRTGLTVLDAEVQVIDPLEEIERSSIDPYSAIRSLYRQRRAVAIDNKPAKEMLGVEGEAFDFEGGASQGKAQ